MAEEVKNEMMDWDDSISADAGSEQNLPPEGEYGFKVIEFEKTFAKSGNKMAKITIQLDKENGQNWKVYDYLVLSDKMAWKLAQFFEALSLKKKGEALDKMPWDKVLGGSGRVKIKHETYEGKESCKVERYLASEAAKAPTAPEVPFEV